MRLSSVASTCLYALSTTSGHAPDESTDGLLGDVLPDLYQGISQLLDSLWCDLAAADGTRHDVPEVLDWIQVCGTGWPVHSINAFVMQELLTHSSHMRTSIVMHEQEPSAQYTRIWPENGSKDLIPVPNGSYRPSG